MKTLAKFPFIAAVAALAIITVGCGGNKFAGTTYSRDHARQGQAIVFATIFNIDHVQIESTDGTIGAISGGIMGGLIGNTIGGGSGKRVATGAGALVGAGAGALIEQAATTINALEISIQHSNGKMEAIVQAAGTDTFQVGQVVRVITNPDGTRRVRPVTDGMATPNLSAPVSPIQAAPAPAPLLP